jgi:hypothetical protein
LRKFLDFRGSLDSGGSISRNDGIRNDGISRNDGIRSDGRRGNGLRGGGLRGNGFRPASLRGDSFEYRRYLLSHLEICLVDINSIFMRVSRAGAQFATLLTLAPTDQGGYGTPATATGS